MAEHQHGFDREQADQEDKDRLISDLRVEVEEVKEKRNRLQAERDGLEERVAHLFTQNHGLGQAIKQFDVELSRLIGNYHSPARTGNIFMVTPESAENVGYAKTSDIEADLKGLHARVETLKEEIGLG